MPRQCFTVLRQRRIESWLGKLGPVERMRITRPAFCEWLHGLQCGFKHGYDLAHAIGSPRGSQSGHGDASYEADQTLKVAEQLGWIRSTGCNPTAEQKFFGVGGLSWSNRSKDQFAKHLYTHGWEPGDNFADGLHATKETT